MSPQITSARDGLIVPTISRGRAIGGSFLPLTNTQIMDLLAAKKQIVERSNQEKDRVLFIDIDQEGECSIAEVFTPNQSLYSYKNGSEIALPEAPTVSEPKPAKGKKGKGKVVTVEFTEEQGLVKVNEKDDLAKAKKSSSNKSTSGDGKPSKKMSTKTKPAKKKAGKKVTAKKAAAPKKILKPKKEGAMPEGQKMTITVKKALELAKKGAKVYRASNGSPFGEFYLKKVKNQDREMDLIVRK